MLEKTFGNIHVAIDPIESLAAIERLDNGEYIIFHLEADFFRDNRDWEEGFRLDHLEDDGVEIQNTTQHVTLSGPEFATVNRYFMQYRNGLLV